MKTIILIISIIRIENYSKHSSHYFKLLIHRNQVMISRRVNTENMKQQLTQRITSSKLKSWFRTYYLHMYLQIPILLQLKIIKTWTEGSNPWWKRVMICYQKKTREHLFAKRVEKKVTTARLWKTSRQITWKVWLSIATTAERLSGQEMLAINTSYCITHISESDT